MKKQLLSLRSLVFASSVVVLGLAGCGKEAPASNAEAAQAVGSVSEEKSADGERATQAKLAAAIECLNRRSGRVFKVRDAPRSR